METLGVSNSLFFCGSIFLVWSSIRVGGEILTSHLEVVISTLFDGTLLTEESRFLISGRQCTLLQSRV